MKKKKNFNRTFGIIKPVKGTYRFHKINKKGEK
jgi:hypothetical protein